jgi:hypothetical protein
MWLACAERGAKHPLAEKWEEERANSGPDVNGAVLKLRGAKAGGRYANGLGAARRAPAYVPGPTAVTRKPSRAKTAPAGPLGPPMR